MIDSPDREAQQRFDAVLEAAGWNLRGVIPTSRYDACVAPPWRSDALLPEARCAVVLGSGGRALWPAFRRSPEYGKAGDPLDAFCERVAAQAALALRGRPVLAHQSRGGVFADLVALGAEEGLGVPSRLSLLVHPVYGPWLSIRAAILTPWQLPTATSLAGFDPCTGCPAPCAEACHGEAVPPGGFQIERCAETRTRESACALRCDARRACVLGQDHQYSPAAEAHHMSLSGVARRV